MKSQENKSVLSCMALCASLFVALSTPSALFAPASDELRVSAYTKHEDLKLKVADLKAMPRTTVSVHNEHSKTDETYVGVRLADVLAKWELRSGTTCAAWR